MNSVVQNAIVTSQAELKVTLPWNARRPLEVLAASGCDTKSLSAVIKLLYFFVHEDRTKKILRILRNQARRVQQLAVTIRRAERTSSQLEFNQNFSRHISMRLLTTAEGVEIIAEETKQAATHGRFGRRMRGVLVDLVAAEELIYRKTGNRHHREVAELICAMGCAAISEQSISKRIRRFKKDNPELWDANIAGRKLTNFIQSELTEIPRMWNMLNGQSAKSSGSGE